MHLEFRTVSERQPARANRIDLLLRLFRDAGSLPAEQRRAWLERECADDPPLVREVLDLFEFERSPVDDGEVLDAALSGLGTSFDLGDDPLLPERIGEFRILQCLGQGGMGIVYRAVQDTPERPVALKVMRAASGTAMTKRFELESRVLGRLQHPGIAQVYAAGTATLDHGECSYFAMELIDGRELTDHVDEADLDARAILALIAEICDAVQHAHDQGVVHRDLKPANILVDGGGRPKILDFGVARLIEGDARSMTEVGSVVGTLAFMSPEQAGGESRAIGPRADVFSLGVILYRLLVGRLPLDLRELSFTEALSAIRNVAPPAIDTLDARLRGDVAVIVAKAMEKAARDRYDSAASLARDIRLHLEEKPILARPPSAVYHMARFARRNRLAVGAALVVLVALITATTVSLRFGLQAEKSAERERAASVELLRGLARDRATRGRDSLRDGEVFEAIALTASAIDTLVRLRREHDLIDDPAEEERLRSRLAGLIDGAPRLVSTARAEFLSGDEGMPWLLLDPTGRYLYCRGDERPRRMRVLDLETGSERGFPWGGKAATVWPSPSLDRAIIDDGGVTVLVDEAGGRTVVDVASTTPMTAGWSPDGRRAWVRRVDSHVRILDGRTGRVIHEYAGKIHDPSVSADGSVAVVSWAKRSETFLVDTRSGETLRVYPGSGRHAMSPAGEWFVRWGKNGLAAGRRDSSVLVQLSDDPMEDARLYAAEIDERGDAWAIRADGQVFLHARDSRGYARPLLVGTHVLSAKSAASFLDERSERLGVASGARTFLLRDPLSGAQTSPSIPHPTDIAFHGFDPAGEGLVLAGHGGLVHRWQPGLPEGGVLDTGRPVSCLAFEPGGKNLAVGDEEGCVRIVDLSSEERRAVLLRHEAPAYSIDWSRDGDRIVVTTGPLDPRSVAGRQARIWDPRTGRALTGDLGRRVWFDRGSREAWLAGEPTRLLLLFANTVNLFDPEVACDVSRCIHAVPWNRTWAVFTPSPDDQRVIAVGGRFLRIWELRTGRLLREVATPRFIRPNDVACGPHGRWVAVASRRGFQLLDAEAAELTQLGEIGNNPAEIVRFSADGTRVISVGSTGDCTVFSPGVKAPVSSWSTGGRVRFCGWSRGRVVTVRRDGRIDVWDPEAGERLEPWRHHGGEVTSAALSEDGRLAVGGPRGRVTIWRPGRADGRGLDGDLVTALAALVDDPVKIPGVIAERTPAPPEPPGRRDVSGADLAEALVAEGGLGAALESLTARGAILGLVSLVGRMRLAALAEDDEAWIASVRGVAAQVLEPHVRLRLGEGGPVQPSVDSSTADDLGGLLEDEIEDLEDSPPSARLRAALGTLRVLQGDLESAARLLEQAHRAATDDPALLLLKARAQIAAGRVTPALESLESGRVGGGEALLAVRAKLSLGRLEGLREELDRLVEDGGAEALLTRGRLRAAEGDAAGARADLDRALEHRDDALARWIRAGLHLDRGDLDAAEEDLAVVVKHAWLARRALPLAVATAELTRRHAAARARALACLGLIPVTRDEAQRELLARAGLLVGHPDDLSVATAPPGPEWGSALAVRRHRFTRDWRNLEDVASPYMRAFALLARLELGLPVEGEELAELRALDVEGAPHPGRLHARVLVDEIERLLGEDEEARSRRQAILYEDRLRQADALQLKLATDPADWESYEHLAEALASAQRWSAARSAWDAQVAWSRKEGVLKMLWGSTLIAPPLDLSSRVPFTIEVVFHGKEVAAFAQATGGRDGPRVMNCRGWTADGHWYRGPIRYASPGRRHFALVYDGKRMRRYLDGKILDEMEAPSPDSPSVRDTLVLGSTGNLIGLVSFRASRVARYRGEFTPPSDLEADDSTIRLYDFLSIEGDRCEDLSGTDAAAILTAPRWMPAHVRPR